MAMATNPHLQMYRVGDYVYYEPTSTSPYQVRRIEELNKIQNGNVEAKVMCFFRRRDLPPSLTFLADRHQSALEEDEGKDRESLNQKQKHLLRHRELFLSRQVETVPANQIRGKCSVTLLNETECLTSYLNKDAGADVLSKIFDGNNNQKAPNTVIEFRKVWAPIIGLISKDNRHEIDYIIKWDTFFYSLVYDPAQKTLLADRGEIRVGSRYQAEAPKPLLKEGESDGRELTELETLVWTPDHGLTDKQIDQFLVISRSVGTFARALDCSSSVKQPSLHMSAAAASRDVTLFHAMDTLHKYSYNISNAVSALVPSSGPLLCRDEMEEWSASEANLFEEALEKYGKDFTDIRSDFLPWKTLKNIIEYYYMWKTTDRYVQQKRVKAAEAETKLKQVFVPNYDKGNRALSGNKGVINGSSTPEPLIPGKPCECCLSSMSSQWFAWSGASGVQARLCNSCWNYWRKYGGLKYANKLLDGEPEVVKKPKVGPSSEDGEPQERSPGLMQPRTYRCTVAGCGKDFKLKNQLARHYATTHGYSMRSGSPRPVMKTRTAFYLHTTPLTRVARRVCSDILRQRHATRSPFWAINVIQIKQECQQRVIGKTPEELKQLVNGRKRKLPNAKVSEIAHDLGQPDRITPEWLILTDKSKLPQPEKVAFPKPPKAPDGTLIYERVPDKQICINNVSPSLLKRRGFEEVNGIDGPPAKRLAWDPQSTNNNPPRDPNRGESPLPLTAQHLPATNTMNARNIINHINGTKAKVTSVPRIGSRKQIMTWMDAPDDLYFCSTDSSKKLRRTLTSNEMRRLARSPCKKAIQKSLPDTSSNVTTAAVPIIATPLIIPPVRSPMPS